MFHSIERFICVKYPFYKARTVHFWDSDFLFIFYTGNLKSSEEKLTLD